MKVKTKTPLQHLVDLTAAPYNPRMITPEAFTALGYSMAEFGDLSGITFNLRTGHLVCGHQRVKLLRERYGNLEIEGDVIRTPEGHEFTIRRVDWPEIKEKAANIAANNPQIAGVFTDDLQALLAELSDEVPELSEGLLLTELIQEIAFEEPTDPVDAPEPKIDQADELRAKWGVEPGQLWLIPSKTLPGKYHRLLCGDSTSSDDVQYLMHGARALLFATDPPYLVDYDGTNHPHGNKDWSESYGITWDDSSQGPELYEGFIKAAIDYAIEPNAAWYCWHASRRQAMVESVWEKYGAFVHQQIIWAKNRPVMTRTHYLWKHEPCFFGWIRGHRPSKVSTEYLSTVWELASLSGKERPEHPTPKPLECFTIPMRQHVPAGGLCYEPFSGSGSQIVAGEQVARQVYAMEISPPYIGVTLERLKDMGLEPELEHAADDDRSVERELVHE